MFCFLKVNGEICHDFGPYFNSIPFAMGNLNVATTSFNIQD